MFVPRWVIALLLIVLLYFVLADRGYTATPKPTCSSFSAIYGQSFNAVAKMAKQPVRIIYACCQQKSVKAFNCHVVVTLLFGPHKGATGCAQIRVSLIGERLGPAKQEVCA